MLKITISGLSGEGKTTLASEIAALLNSLKMNVSVNDIDLNHCHEIHEDAVFALAGHEVLVETATLTRQKCRPVVAGCECIECGFYHTGRSCMDS